MQARMGTKKSDDILICSSGRASKRKKKPPWPPGSGWSLLLGSYLQAAMQPSTAPGFFQERRSKALLRS
eukprot:1157012-Pelagomonas_calceolata.AAC.5